ncbi:MAG: addiction module protein [Burkholderiaceae bacterium]|nr:addiction module protein [Burkholderiaceae bacterium]
MHPQIADELIHLSAADKRELGEALIASAEAEVGARSVSDAQRAELRARLAHHRAQPEEPGVTLQELRVKLLGAAA